MQIAQRSNFRRDTVKNGLKNQLSMLSGRQRIYGRQRPGDLKPLRFFTVNKDTADLSRACAV